MPVRVHIHISLRNTIVFMIIQASVHGVPVGQATGVLVGNHHLIICAMDVHFHKARSKKKMKIKSQAVFYFTCQNVEGGSQLSYRVAGV